MMTRSLTSALFAIALISLTGCMTPPPDLDLSLQHPSRDGRYIVTLRPPAAPPAINPSGTDMRPARTPLSSSRSDST